MYKNEISCTILHITVIDRILPHLKMEIAPLSKWELEMHLDIVFFYLEEDIDLHGNIEQLSWHDLKRILLVYILLNDFFDEFFGEIFDNFF